MLINGNAKNTLNQHGKIPRQQKTREIKKRRRDWKQIPWLFNNDCTCSHNQDRCGSCGWWKMNYNMMWRTARMRKYGDMNNNYTRTITNHGLFAVLSQQESERVSAWIEKKRKEWKLSVCITYVHFRKSNQAWPMYKSTQSNDVSDMIKRSEKKSTKLFLLGLKIREWMKQGTDTHTHRQCHKLFIN